jgi:hypothetical protein
MPIASAKFTHGARSIKTGAVGTPSRWLVSFSVAARLPEIRRSAGPTRSSSANASASAVSMASSPRPSRAIGQPRRSASIARATWRGSLKCGIP